MEFLTRILLLVAMASAFLPSGAMASSSPAELQALLGRRAPSERPKTEAEHMRPNAIREAARTLGVQTAVRWRYDQILRELDSRSSELDRIFDFAPLLMNDAKVLPPVIVQADNNYRLENDAVATATDVTYQIHRDARLASTPPNWRDYLWREFAAVEEVSPALLPKTDEEIRIWQEAAKDGWRLGLVQAERVFDANLSRLVRDYRGMLRFKALALQGVVSIPVFAEGKVGIKIGEKTLDVGQRVFRITNPATFQNPREWNPAVWKTRTFGSTTNR